MKTKRFCFFIKQKSGETKEDQYTRGEKFFLSLRIRKWKAAWEYLWGADNKIVNGYYRTRWIWEGNEDNPMPYVFLIGLFINFMV